jgi:hypothetical protein
MVTDQAPRAIDHLDGDLAVADRGNGVNTSAVCAAGPTGKPTQRRPLDPQHEQNRTDDQQNRGAGRIAGREDANPACGHPTRADGDRGDPSPDRQRLGELRRRHSVGHSAHSRTIPTPESPANVSYTASALYLGALSSSWPPSRSGAEPD